MLCHLLKIACCFCVIYTYSLYAYADTHQLAYSKKMGVAVYADGAPDWCREELKIIVEADKEGFFDSNAFQKLVLTIGDRVLPHECDAASKIILTGKSDKQVCWRGTAEKESRWTIVAQQIKDVPSEQSNSKKRDTGNVSHDFTYPFPANTPVYQDEIAYVNDGHELFLPSKMGDMSVKRYVWAGKYKSISNKNVTQPTGSGELTLFGQDNALIQRLKIGPNSDIGWVEGRLFWNSDIKVDYEQNKPFKNYHKLYTYTASIDVYIPKELNLHNQSTIFFLNRAAFNYLVKIGVDISGLSDKKATITEVQISMRDKEDRANSKQNLTNYTFNAKGEQINASRHDNKALSRFNTEQKRSREEAQRQQQMRTQHAEQAHIRELRAASEKQWKSKWQAELESDEPWENLTDLMRFNKGAAIAKLSAGHKILYEYEQIEFSEGKAILKDYQKGTNIYEGIPEGKFSWDSWFEQTSTPIKSSFSVYCSVEPSVVTNLTEGQKHILSAKLNTIIGSNIILDCDMSKQDVRASINLIKKNKELFRAKERKYQESIKVDEPTYTITTVRKLRNITTQWTISMSSNYVNAKAKSASGFQPDWNIPYANIRSFDRDPHHNLVLRLYCTGNYPGTEMGIRLNPVNYVYVGENKLDTVLEQAMSRLSKWKQQYGEFHGRDWQKQHYGKKCN